MNNSTDLEELVSWQSGPTERGGWSIIYSCLAVVVVSTWTALHLNVPKQPDRISSGPRSALTRKKIKWTIIMIVSPEVVFAKAVLELKMALDDHIAMYERQRSLHLKGWRVSIGFWSFALHRLLHGTWPSKALWRDSFPRIIVHGTGTDNVNGSHESVAEGHDSYSMTDLRERGNPAVGGQQHSVHASRPGSDIVTAEPMSSGIQDDPNEMEIGLRKSPDHQHIRSTKDLWPDFRYHDDPTKC